MGRSQREPDAGSSPRSNRKGFCLRFNSLGDDLLQAPELAIPDSQSFKMTDRAVEIFGHRSRWTRCRSKGVSDLIRRKPAEVARTAAIDDERDRPEGCIIGLHIYPVRRVRKGLGANFATKEPAKIDFDRIPWET